MLLVHGTCLTGGYKVASPMSCRNVRTENGIGVYHHTDSDALYAVGGGNTGPTSSVTTNLIPYYLDKKYRREDTPV